MPLILRSREDATFLLLWEGDDRGFRKVSEKNLRLRIRELGFDQSFVSLRDDKNRPRTPESIFEEYGATYLHTAHAFANRITTYDPSGEGRVTIGYTAQGIPPVFDTATDEWLRALAGEHYDRLAVWVASCAQSSINRLAACLIIVGEKDSGKSMFGHAVAQLWGSSPVPAHMLVTDFNWDLLRGPILVDEEAQLFGSKQLSTKKFRDEIQAVSRSVQPKHKERVPLIGALRLIVPCNAIGDLRFSDVGGPSVVEAVADRIALIDARPRADACRAALAKLRVPRAYTVDLDRVARHMAWICANTELPAERFLGSGGADSETAILAGHLESDPEVWESLRDWLGSSGLGPIWNVHKGSLVVDDMELAKSLENAGHGYDLRRVRSALAAVASGERYQARLESGRARVTPLDHGRLGRAMPDIAAQLVTRLAEERPAQTRAQGGRFGRLA